MNNQAQIVLDQLIFSIRISGTDFFQALPFAPRRKRLGKRVPAPDMENEKKAQQLRQSQQQRFHQHHATPLSLFVYFYVGVPVC